MEAIKWESAVDDLLVRFPEIFAAYQQELEWWKPDKPGAHVVLADLFCPYVEGRIESDESLATRVFDFIEELAASSDDRIKELFGVTVLPFLKDDLRRYRFARQHFGPHARQLTKEIERD